MQGRKRDTDVENRYAAMAEGRGVRGRVNWKIRSDIHAPPCVKQIASRNLLYVHHGRSPVLCDDLEGWDGVGAGKQTQDGGDICIHGADSLSCMAATNTTV